MHAKERFKMISLGFVFSILLTVLASANAAEHCVTHGSCAIDDDTGLPKPCVYNGSAIPLNDSSAIDSLKKLCPTIKTGPDFAVCCSAEEIVTFQIQLDTLASLFKRCPSCYYNLANVFCNMICSPEQSLFLEVTKSVNNSVEEMSYYITEYYANGLFDSCKNVQLAFTTDKAISITCGVNPHEPCSPHKWLTFMGSRENSPYEINFQFEIVDNVTVGDKIFYPMNETIVPCSQAVTIDGAPCSCVDCPCQPHPPPLPPKEKKLFGLPVLSSVMIMIYVAFSIICIFEFVYFSYRPKTDDEEMLIVSGAEWEKHPSLCEQWGASLDDWLKNLSTQWATFCASYPILVLFLGFIFVLFCSIGLLFFTVVTNPVELWSSPNSQAREEKDYFDQHFGPFYRTEQIIITRKSGDPVKSGNLTFSSIFDRKFLHQILELQKNISILTVEKNNRIVHFEDICFAPVEKRRCMIISPLNWFQNNAKHLDYYSDVEYLHFLQNCTSNPMYVQKKGLSCLGDYGGPIFPYIALGGFEGDNYANASALIITFMVNNHINAEDNEDAIEWEKKFIEFMKNFSDPNIEFSFSSERSIQDELDRESHSDEATIVISYLVMFAYVSITLGQYNSFSSLFVKSKILLGLSGVLIVLASVVCSLGIFSYIGVPVTLIIIEVIPFLVLAVGVDNIFIIVQGYQRSTRAIHETREQHIGRVVGQIIPSILLASFAESTCFLIGALSTMPAVHIFALYSGVALLIDFLLQISCFVAVLSLDAAREDEGRLDICCCIKYPESEKSTPKHGFLYRLFENYYAPFLMKNPVRCIVVLIFSGWLCLSIASLGSIEIGLDQKLSMPKDSYVLKYFKSLEKYLSVGPPVYFVVKAGYKYEEFEDQNSLCSVVFCNHESLVAQISDASKFSNSTYIAHPPMDWLDNYFSWVNDQSGCCRVYVNDTTKFCPSYVKKPLCKRCQVASDATQFRPYPDKFHTFLLDFLQENPTPDCPVAGHAAFANALEINNGTIGATHFMTYHTILKTSNDYIQALKSAREISRNITKTFHKFNVSDPEAEVFPYSIFYVFYEQYLTIEKDSVISLIISLTVIFLVTLVLMGLDFHSAIIMVFTILMILQDLLGLMSFWNISLNAISLVNLVMAVGICVEFCSHIIRSFAFSTEGSKIDRARNAVAHMGSSILSGITLTKFGGIVVLAFSKSQIFQIFYFRMYLGIVLIGATHGLIFLPVFLSIAGPSIKRRIDSNSRGKPLKTSLDEDTGDKESSIVN